MAGTGDLSLLDSVQNDSGAHPVSYQVGTEGSFRGGGVKLSGLTALLRLVPR
jgi:hypothetical protein